jgi:hypothetical protein
MLRKRARVVGLLLVGAGAATALIVALGAPAAGPRTGPLIVHARLDRPPGRFVRGDGLYDGGGRHSLAAAVSGALMGPLSPVAVSSPAGSALLYSSWQKLRPVDPRLSFSKQGIGDGDELAVPWLRARDADGHDTPIERGAYSAAWRADGAIAYVKGVDAAFQANRPYIGDVYVRDGIHGRSVRWTTGPARYVVYAWAGKRLLFYRIGEGESLQLFVASGPGQVRPLADGSAIAVSPDGSRVLVLSPDSTNVRILDVATGREQGWLDVTTASTALRWVGYSGSWVGDRVVAPASSGLAVFHVSGDSITLEQALSFDQAQFPAGVQEPRFADDAGNEIVATADVPLKNGADGASFFLDCDRVSRTCERGDAAPASDWPRLVANPSRPGGAR